MTYGLLNIFDQFWTVIFFSKTWEVVYIFQQQPLRFCHFIKISTPSQTFWTISELTMKNQVILGISGLKGLIISIYLYRDSVILFLLFFHFISKFYLVKQSQTEKKGSFRKYCLFILWRGVSSLLPSKLIRTQSSIFVKTY